MEEPHIYCVEGYWGDGNLGDNTQVEGMLKLNHDNCGMPYIRRNCATLDEMHFWFATEWSELPEGSILYIATHGAPGQIWLSEQREGSRPQVEAISALPDTSGAGEMLGQRCMIHFSGCRVLDMRDEDLDDFMTRSGTAVVSGFMNKAGFLDGANAGLALESQLFNSIGPNANLELHLLQGDNEQARGRRSRLLGLEKDLQGRYPDCGFRLRLSPAVRACDD